MTVMKNIENVKNISRKQRAAVVLAAGMVLCVLAVPAQAQPEAAGGAGAIQKRLDGPVELAVSDTPIEDVFKTLAKNTGVKFQIDPAALELLPYGNQTRLNVIIKGTTLRKALPQMLGPQGLGWKVEGDEICITPSGPLYRMCRRATFNELKALGAILTKRLAKADRGQNATLTRVLRRVTGVKEMKVVYPQGMDAKRVRGILQKTRQAQPLTAAQWLDAFCRAGDLSWYLDKTRVVILSRKLQIERQLERKVSLRYQNSRLMQVMLDLARKAQVKLTFAPGVMNLLKPEARTNFTLIMADATISQAMEVISGTTGLKFTVTGKGIAVAPSAHLQAGSPTAGNKTPQQPAFFIQTSIRLSSGSEVKIFLLPEQMSENLQKAITAERKRLMKNLEKHFAPPDGHAAAAGK
ncbi:MAG: DUF4974 domain-containing protein [Phycisphaerae bacterium]|nr:DUF4974 domain-containing protein [Phycisphaerae bacterium]